MGLEEGQIVLCTVTKIVGTAVFVRIDNSGEEGTIITSEIAPGRIRNLRDYVVPNKKIVCKILRISDKGRIDMSLRRVTAKEKRETIEANEKEKSLAAAIRTVTSNSEQIIKRIKEKSSLVGFFEEAKEKPEILEILMPKEESEKMLKILNAKKEKAVYVKRRFLLYSKAEDGIKMIKSILPEDAAYISAGNFSIEIKDKNYKEGNRKIEKLLKEIEEKAKKNNCVFELPKQK